MMKVKNANVGREENYEEGGSSRGGRTGKGKGKGKRVATEVRLPERFISVKEAANFEEWTRKKRKIVPGYRVDLSDMEGEVLKRHDDRNANKLDAYGRLLHHMISHIIIPNNKRCTTRGSRVIYKEAKRFPKITRLYEDEVIKLKTLKTRRMVRDSFIRFLINYVSSLEETFFEKLSLKN
ncbi:hypothetical protein M9H77_12678 [Catharanthus roseus]|uniref:Uncharacterized protein n=1 Tax=Catharanthus roseus TaxID=4058 RepID=A0ACC0BI65_CATRO|nr:hypothetical protein M9H77_12678 [Catharanthus roseus]